jgi:hypothetical protein
MRCTLALLGLLSSLVAGTLLLRHDKHALGAPVPPPKGVPDVSELSRQARSKDKATRERAVGHLLKRLKKGMTRAQVEDLIGPPHRPLDERFAELGETEDAVYYARFPGDPEFHLMYVQYDTRKRPWRFVKVERYTLDD